MYLKALIGVVISATTIVAAFAQDEPTNQAPKPSLADVQHLAETISSDESRLRAYCDLGKLHDDTQQAVEEKDAEAIDELIAKTVAAMKEINPDYLIPMHCTGFRTIMAIQREMPEKLIMPSTGTRVVFGA